MDTLAPPPRHTWPCLRLTELLSSGDLDAAAACLARDACLLTQDATAIHGRDYIRPALAQLIARNVHIDVDLCSVIDTGDVALVRERWSICIDGIEGSQFEQSCNPTLVLRRIEEQWKLAIVAPWGWGGEQSA